MGITVALQLSTLGRRVILLESGDISADEPANTELASTPSVGYPVRGLFGSTVEPATFTVRKLGGGSTVFAGFCHPLEARDLVGWPITEAELDPWYPVAHDYFGLGPVDYDVNHWASALSKPPPPSFGPDLVVKVSQQRPQNFGSVYLPTLTGSADIELLHHANVTNLNATAGGSHIGSVTVRTLTGVTFSVDATHFVLACGGIQTPRLLLMSNDVVAPGVGNQYDQVGRYYADHLASGFAFAYLRPTMSELAMCTPIEHVATTTPAGQPTEINLKSVIDMSDAASAALGCSLHMEMTLFDFADCAKPASGVGPKHIIELMAAQGRSPSCQGVFRTFLKPTANASSRVRLASSMDALGRPRAELDWQPATVDAANRKAAMRFVSEQLRQSGIGQIHNTLGWTTPDLSLTPANLVGYLRINPTGDEPDPYHETALHNMCTTRMSSDPHDGVVDANCRVHTTDNLHVAGPSVFRTGSGYYPTMPAIALGARLANHLDGVMP